MPRLVSISRSRLVLVSVAALVVVSANPGSQERPAAVSEAGHHHQLGVEHHLRRSLDAASREYARALDVDPPRDVTPSEMAVVKRFSPRVHVTPTEFFPLRKVDVVFPEEVISDETGVIPLGLELLLDGTIRYEAVHLEGYDHHRLPRIRFLGRDVAVQHHVFPAQAGDRNTRRIGVVVITSGNR